MKHAMEYMLRNLPEIMGCGKYLFYFISGGCLTTAFLWIVFRKEEKPYTPITPKVKKPFKHML